MTQVYMDGFFVAQRYNEYTEASVVPSSGGGCHKCAEGCQGAASQRIQHAIHRQTSGDSDNTRGTMATLRGEDKQTKKYKQTRKKYNLVFEYRWKQNKANTPSPATLIMKIMIDYPTNPPLYLPTDLPTHLSAHLLAHIHTSLHL